MTNRVCWVLPANASGSECAKASLQSAAAIQNRLENGSFLGNYATAAGNLDIVRTLLAAKPDLDWRCPALGSTTLMLALVPHGSVVHTQLPPSGRWDIIQALVEAGANVNVMTRAGVTAWMLEVDGPTSLAMVQALLTAHGI